MPIKDKEKRREYNRLYQLAHYEQYKASQKKYHGNQTHYQRHKQWWQDNKRRIAIRVRQGNAERKVDILTHYGEGKPACVVCKEARVDCLSIDHIEGGGTQHRLSLAKKGMSFYRWLQDNGYPEGYQTLCMNCQFIKKAEERSLKYEGS